MPSPKKKVEVPSEEVKVEETVVEAPKVEEIKVAEPKVEVAPAVKRATPVIFESLDGRKMWVSINKWEGSGTRIECPRELADDAERILKAAKYLFTKIA